MTQYFDCAAERISYNIMGIATINYTIISDNPNPNIPSTFSAGGVNFAGVVINYNTQLIPKSEHSSTGGWYTTNVTLVATS
jgi:hypothetical protein